MQEYPVTENTTYESTGSAPSPPPSSPFPPPERREIAFPPSRESAVRAACRSGSMAQLRETTPELADISIETVDLADVPRVKRRNVVNDSDSDEEHAPVKKARHDAPHAPDSSPTPASRTFLVLQDLGKNRRAGSLPLQGVSTRAQSMLEELRFLVEEERSQRKEENARQQALIDALRDQLNEKLAVHETELAVHGTDLKLLLGEYELKHQTVLAAYTALCDRLQSSARLEFGVQRFINALALNNMVKLAHPLSDTEESQAETDSRKSLAALDSFRATDPCLTKLLLLDAERCNELCDRQHAAAHPSMDWHSYLRLHGSVLRDAGYTSAADAMDAYKRLGAVQQKRWASVGWLFPEPTPQEQEAVRLEAAWAL
ncbi:hypothetical protein JCM3770_002768 [Rhodotorula araucariae]